MTASRIGLVLVGAGSARRMGGIDKVWALLGEQPILWHSWNILAPAADHCVVVVRAEHVEAAQSLFDHEQRTTVVAGGPERQASVGLGLKALRAVDIVAVHDIARPLVGIELLLNGVKLAELHGAAVPVLPLADTVKRLASNGCVFETVDRDHLRAAQTPQIFQWDLLNEARVRATEADFRGTDDVALVHDVLRRPVVTYPGSPRNFKITTNFDLELARLLVGRELS